MWQGLSDSSPLVTECSRTFGQIKINKNVLCHMLKNLRNGGTMHGSAIDVMYDTFLMEKCIFALWPLCFSATLHTSSFFVVCIFVLFVLFYFVQKVYNI